MSTDSAKLPSQDSPSPTSGDSSDQAEDLAQALQLTPLRAYLLWVWALGPVFSKMGYRGGTPKAPDLAWTGGIDLSCFVLGLGFTPRKRLRNQAAPVPEAASCISWCHLFQGQMKAVAWLYPPPCPSLYNARLTHSLSSFQRRK